MDRPLASDARRQAWRDFICSPDHAGRFLSSIGNAVAPAVSDQIHLDELNSFLASLEGGTEDALFLALVIELSSESYREFIEKRLALLLDQLSAETTRRHETVGPAARGAVRWMRTKVDRRLGRLPYGRYYSITAHRTYDIAENRVVRRLLTAMQVLLAEAAELAGAGRLPARLEKLRHRVEALQSHDAMRGLSATRITDRLDLEAGERSHRAPYREAARLVRALDRIGDRDDNRRWYALLMLLATGWLEPVSDDDIFELYVLALVLDVLANECDLGIPVEYGLVRANRRHVARFDANGTDLLVHFDISLARILKRGGRYSATVASYDGITGAERRPDIVLTRQGADERRVLLIEVKRSDDGRYLSDSIYKVFGYLYDFEGSDVDLDAVLAVPESVGPIQAGTPSAVTIVSGDDRPALTAALQRFLEPLIPKSDPIVLDHERG